MPRMIRFLPANFRHDAFLLVLDRHGKSISCRPGDTLATVMVDSPTVTELVSGGWAVIEGKDDGSSVEVLAFLRELRSLISKYGIMQGAASTFSLEAMVKAMREVKATDDAQVLAYATAQTTQGGKRKAGGVDPDAGTPEAAVP